MNIETIIWLCFSLLLFVGCLEGMLIRFEIVELEEKIEDLQDEIRRQNERENSSRK